MAAASAESKRQQRRPPARRDEIATNASELFSARGFHAVRMGDIAEATGITARAVYRHYDSKQALLAHVVLADQQRLIDALASLSGKPAEARDVDSTLTDITNAALDSRRLSVLWQREARHLNADDYRLVRTQTRRMARQFHDLLIGQERPDLDAATAEVRIWLVVSIVTSPGHHEYTLSRQRLTGELIEASRRVITQPAAVPADEHAGGDTRRTFASRREQLIRAAAHAFRENGFGGVSIDDIGGEVGVVGPALYRYFGNKAEILVAAMTRLDEWLALEMTRAMRAASKDESVIAKLVEGYVRVALEATDLLAVSLNERLYLPAADRERLDRVQADYMAEWQRWLAIARPELPEAHAAMLVRTAKTMVDDCVRIPHLRHYPVLPAELASSTCAALGVTTD